MYKADVLNTQFSLHERTQNFRLLRQVKLLICLIDLKVFTRKTSLQIAFVLYFMKQLKQRNVYVLNIIYYYANIYLRNVPYNTKYNKNTYTKISMYVVCKNVYCKYEYSVVMLSVALEYKFQISFCLKITNNYLLYTTQYIQL